MLTGFLVQLCQPHVSWPVPLVTGESQWQEEMELSSGHYQSFSGDRGLSRGTEKGCGCITSFYLVDPSSYFSVSNLLFLGKTTERFIAKLYEWHICWDRFQSSFWSGYRIETVLVTLADDLCRQLDWGIGSDGIARTHSSIQYGCLWSFDPQPHWHRSTWGCLEVPFHLRWGQRVVLGKRMSSRHPLICGIPQEVILSLMLLTTCASSPNWFEALCLGIISMLMPPSWSVPRYCLG